MPAYFSQLQKGAFASHFLPPNSPAGEWAQFCSAKLPSAKKRPVFAQQKQGGKKKLPILAQQK